MAEFLASGGYERWLKELRVSDAPLTRQGLATVLTFFHSRMPGLDRDGMRSFLRGVDLHKRVTEVHLAPGTKLAAYRFPGPSTNSCFYTKAGTSVHNLGIRPVDRKFVRVEVKFIAHALECRAASIIDTWSNRSDPYPALGGGIQFIVAHAPVVLRPATNAPPR